MLPFYVPFFGLTTKREWHEGIMPLFSLRSISFFLVFDSSLSFEITWIQLNKLDVTFNSEILSFMKTSYFLSFIVYLLTAFQLRSQGICGKKGSSFSFSWIVISFSTRKSVCHGGHVMQWYLSKRGVDFSVKTTTEDDTDRVWRWKERDWEEQEVPPDKTKDSVDQKEQGSNTKYEKSWTKKARSYEVM